MCKARSLVACHLVSRVTARYFGHILLIRKTLRGVTQGADVSCEGIIISVKPAHLTLGLGADRVSLVRSFMRDCFSPLLKTG